MRVYQMLLLSLITLHGSLSADASSEAETTSAVGSSYFRNNIQYHVMETQIPRDTFRQVSRADATAKHELVFAVPQMNLSLIESMLMERSSPDNALYQQWLSFDEIGSLVRNTASAEAVRNWLMLCDVDITWVSRHSTYIKAVATIGEWEKMLDTIFYEWEDVSKRGSFTKKDRIIHRALSFSLPTYIKDHVSAVFNTVQTPPEFRPKYKLKSGNSNTPFKTYLRGPFTYAFKDFCQLTCLLVLAQKCTLISSLSEFISVFEQPTSSVVFRRFSYLKSKFRL